MFSQPSIAMSAEPENKLTAAAAGAVEPEAPTALVRTGGEPGSGRHGAARDTRLDHLRTQLDVMVRVHSFCVGDLLALRSGSVLETIQDHSQDVPVHCGGVVLVWAEFEVVNQRMAVRITRLA
jgi:flagellar motor switch/type III secretory pathway protein FliN